MTECEEVELEGKRLILCYGCTPGGCWVEIRSPDGRTLIERSWMAG